MASWSPRCPPDAPQMPPPRCLHGGGGGAPQRNAWREKVDAIDAIQFYSVEGRGYSVEGRGYSVVKLELACAKRLAGASGGVWYALRSVIRHAGRAVPRPSGGTGRPERCTLGGRGGRGDGDSAKSRTFSACPGVRGGPRRAHREAGGQCGPHVVTKPGGATFPNRRAA